ncbi:MAG: type II toxin-antitoxin system HigB family toxin [Mucilaginibacter sp.]|uniref:type II toxin-antitoxin system HigB family toxin n=1 Tax=Mucilaginibacter sp. L3T2-6 TaxID=3062491 RepID=UPI002674FED8|nr:type II toxin-antitoxin system HigB family toxin [Mucilaginibacter sp. L3T2-6]MDO3642091.1 type II toxin-antitoxin system HigB family toxin [Mucilaginibacter sp. L3T2-6]MDV6214585.1 type II toxin-antitoxin system HigB family toxin [Mucilaginibacter sp. L3T2-6]
MRVHLVKRQTLDDFSNRNARSKTSLDDWIEKLKLADWEGPADIKRTYNSADLLGGNSNRVIFDIAGNNYRMICKYFFGAKQVHLFVCWLGTHAEYDKICNRGEQYTINLY